MLETIDRVAISVQKWTGVVLASVGASVIVVWVFVMTVNIIYRALLGSVWQFVDEYTGYFYLVTVSLGFAYATFKGKHISVRVFSSRFKGKFQKIWECMTVVLAIWWVSFLTPRVIGWVSESFSGHTVSLQTQTPLWIFILILAIGLCSLLLNILILLYHAAFVAYGRKGEIVKDELSM
ncbi:TRAP transporter small permease [Chloroflexota bacterium]